MAAAAKLYFFYRMEQQPFFSIITVTYNVVPVIGPTVRSIGEQSFTDFEWLVQDGASADGTPALARDAGIARTRVWSEPDRGLYDAMNKAVAKARGRYVVFLNAGDCFAGPDALQRMHDCAEGLDPGVIYGQTQLVDASGRVVGMRHLTAPRHLTWRSFGRGMLVCHQAFAARRDLVELYNLAYRFSADYDWCIRVLKKSPVNAYAGDAPIISFLSDGGLTDRNHKASLRERYRIMCHYYGTLPTIARHISFVPRYVLTKLKRKLRG